MNAGDLSKLSEALRLQAEVELIAMLNSAFTTPREKRLMSQRFVEFVIAAAVNEVAASLARVREEIPWQDTGSFTRDGL